MQLTQTFGDVIRYHENGTIEYLASNVEKSTAEYCISVAGENERYRNEFVLRRLKRTTPKKAVTKRKPRRRNNWSQLRFDS
jgi:hypothetical protein